MNMAEFKNPMTMKCFFIALLMGISVLLITEHPVFAQTGEVEEISADKTPFSIKVYPFR